MYGASIGKLNVFIKTIIGTSVTGTRLVWQLTGNQGNQWSQGRLPLRTATAYQVRGFRDIRNGGLFISFQIFNHWEANPSA